jgi:hypothetical protein
VIINALCHIVNDMSLEHYLLAHVTYSFAQTTFLWQNGTSKSLCSEDYSYSQTLIFL